MARTIPEVRIKYAWLLTEVASIALNEQWGEGAPLRSYEEYASIADQYEKWWRPNNDTIMQGICDIFNLEFRQNIIDVNVAPWFSPISDPMVIPPMYSSEDEVVNTLSHELLHRLLTDNTSTDYDRDLLKDWKKLFGEDHTINCLIHIPVHAGMKMLYTDIINRPDLVEFDINRSKKYPDYAMAWEYVEANDYKEIIDKLRRV